MLLRGFRRGCGVVGKLQKGVEWGRQAECHSARMLRSSDRWGLPEIGDPSAYYATVNSRILITRTPKYGTPYFRKLPSALEQMAPRAQALR